MCRTFPGFRCSSHPHLAVRVVSRKIHNKEVEIESAIEEQRQFRAETADWEGTDEDKEFDIAIDKLRAEITVLENRRTKELEDFMMTPTGKEILQQAIDKSKEEEEALAKEHETNSKYTEEYWAKRAAKERALAHQRTIDLENEMVAAEGRRAKQAKLASYMTKPEVSNSAKMWRVKRELKKTMKEMGRYSSRDTQIKERLEALNEEMLHAKQSGDIKEQHYLNEERALLLKEKSFLDKQMKHTRAHLASCQSWVKKIRESKVDKIFDFADNLALKYIDHMFQT